MRTDVRRMGRTHGEDTDGGRGARISKGTLEQKCLPLDWMAKRGAGEGGRGTLAAWLQFSLEGHMQNPAQRRRKRGRRAAGVEFQGIGLHWRRAAVYVGRWQG